ncbi:glycyl-radical enzyme activating protein [Erwinia papayae]|uniref:Glycyl-radical enzyme activating protein n=1 Tax=Erwinia papayae TaxID=206499 RepID=A0ABV3N0E8_9GAMM
MEKVDYQAEGILFNIQRYSLHDGPGIRTIAFFKGCPLACKWCSNPESQSPRPELIYKNNNCIRCGRCVAACEQQAIEINNRYFVNRERCIQCAKCTEVCPVGALEMKGRRITVAEVILQLQKDENLYRRSDGGITLSGGEPLAQPVFARELLKACKQRGWHTAIETTGLTTPKIIDDIFPWVDLALTDIKAINPVVHRHNTGVDNRLIMENLIRISSITQAVVRIPVIPGVNDNQQEMQRIAGFARLMSNVTTIHLLPYHNFGENKYDLLGRDYLLSGYSSVSPEKIASLQETIVSSGFECLIGG